MDWTILTPILAVGFVVIVTVLCILFCRGKNDSDFRHCTEAVCCHCCMTVYKEIDCCYDAMFKSNEESVDETSDDCTVEVNSRLASSERQRGNILEIDPQRLCEYTGSYTTNGLIRKSENDEDVSELDPLSPNEINDSTFLLDMVETDTDISNSCNENHDSVPEGVVIQADISDVPCTNDRGLHEESLPPTYSQSRLDISDEETSPFSNHVQLQSAIPTDTPHDTPHDTKTAVPISELAHIVREYISDPQDNNNKVDVGGQLPPTYSEAEFDNIDLSSSPVPSAPPIE